MGKLLTATVEERRSAAISFHNKMTNNTERRWMAEYVYPTKPWKGKSLIEAMQETEKWMNEREERHCRKLGHIALVCPVTTTARSSGRRSRGVHGAHGEAGG